jgi:hypothetical protein
MNRMTEVIDGCKTSPKRAIRWTLHPASAGCTCEGLLEIHCCRGSKAYTVTEFSTTWDGRAFTLTKADGDESYNVFVGRDWSAYQCDCAGFCYGRDKPCRHVLAMVAVLANGWLPDPRANPDQDVGPTELTDQELPDCFRDEGHGPSDRCPF